MAYIQRCFIRKNSEELQNRLQQIGLKICCCCNFEGACWLSFLPLNGTVHGVGYGDETMSYPQYKILEMFLSEYDENEIDCGENEDMFVYLCALRDDTDDGQIFTNGKGDWGIYHDDEPKGELSGIEFLYMPKDNDISNYHKATAKEIVELFSKKGK